MIPNHSPWIKQLNRTRPVVPVSQNFNTDVAIVGGGIAGVVTAFYTLRDTDKKVILIEATKIAHGATGHNAGQITSYFERPFADIVKEFGLGLAVDGQKSIESAWLLIDQIIQEAELQTPLYRFTGYAGLSSMEKVLDHLENNLFRKQGGLQTEAVIISEEWEQLSEIPEKYAGLFSIAKHKNVLDLLDTNNHDYVAVLAFQKGCMNSALFTEEIIVFLKSKYPDRFMFFEESPVKNIVLEKDSGILEILSHKITAGRVVLCTNGFEDFTIKNNFGEEIDTKFHHSVNGRVGYMLGYVEPIDHPPTAISYFPRVNENANDPTGESYFYLTRRPHEHEGKKSYNLICTGGPEKVLPNGAIYSRTDSCSDDIRIVIDDFLRANYGKHPSSSTEYSFCWHGLMGYTPNGIRRVGIEPRNPTLLYNLGCNGVGILPSIYGGKRISQILYGEILGKSIFDPVDSRIA